MNTIELSIFASRISAVCDEMGAALRRAAFSPNIRDRLDYSCAVFDAQGGLCAQAAHIPVHLGSMAFAMAGLVETRPWQAGDMVVVNDPYQGGTHLPDVTVIAPLIAGHQCMGFVANRAHHADIGADQPGSMPITKCLDDEGLVIPPTLLLKEDKLQRVVLDRIISATSNASITEGDFSAQVSANRTGIARISELIETTGAGIYLESLAALNDYGERLARHALNTLPDGQYRFTDFMDDDGFGAENIRISVCIRIENDDVDVDFSNTADQVSGNINCPLPVTVAAVFYAFRCLMDAQTPACAGSFRPLRITVPDACLLNADYPAAVAAGNVETSSRIVDVVLGALAQAVSGRIPAASQGTMNNLAMGSRSGKKYWNYYETLGGGMGAGKTGGGLSAVQTHMTNTLNTPVEVVEANYPLRILGYSIRRGSGGQGVRMGGDGLVREYRFLDTAELTVISERRQHAPWGLAGGESGLPGENLLNGKQLPAKASVSVEAGDRLLIKTPGGGGYGNI